MYRRFVLAGMVLSVLIIISCQSAGMGQTQQPSSVVTDVPDVPTSPSPTTIPPTTPPLNVVKDDFSSQTDIWDDCEYCQWIKGLLLLGPNPDAGVGSNQTLYLICRSCGLRTYYQISAKIAIATLATRNDGTLGLLVGITDDKNKIYTALVVPAQRRVIYDRTNIEKDRYTFEISEQNVVEREGVYHLDVTIKPSTSSGLADIIVMVNGVKVLELHEQPVEPTWAGLYLTGNGVGVFFDDFEYKEISAN